MVTKLEAFAELARRGSLTPSEEDQLEALRAAQGTPTPAQPAAPAVSSRRLDALAELENRGSINPDEQAILDASRAAERTQNPSFMNEAIARGVGYPVDLANVLLGGRGGEKGDTAFGLNLPIGGYESIAQGMRKLGITLPVQTQVPMPGPDYAMTRTEVQQPQTLSDYMGRSIGEAATFMIPGGGLARLAEKSARPLLSRVGKTVSESIRNSPFLAGVTELFAASGAGAGRMVGEKNFPNNPTAQTVTELAFGLGIGYGPTIVGAVARITPGVAMGVRTTERLGRAAAVPFTKSGARARASRRVRELAENPGIAASRMGRDDGLSPAARTGDRGLLALEREVLKTDAKLRGQFRKERTQTTKNLRKEIEDIGGGGEIATTRQFLSSRVDRIIAALDSRIKQAATLSKQRVAALSPVNRAARSSQIVREEVEGALKSARDQEKEFWRNVADQNLFSTKETFQKYADIVDDLSRAQMDNIPDKARQFLDPESNSKFGEVETIKELHGLYSALREGSRTARGAGEWNKARISDDLADALLEDMGAGANSVTRSGQSITEARAYSRLLNEKFHRGKVGRILGYAGEGGSSVDPELTLDVAFRGGDRPASVAARQLAKATEEAPEKTQGAIQEFFRQKFVDAVVRDGAVDADRAKTFLRSNQETLTQYPDLKQDIIDSLEAATALKGLGASTAARTTALESPATSKAAALLKANVGQEIDQIIKSSNPLESAQQLALQASKDKTGEASLGLKGGFIDYLLDKSSLSALNDDQIFEPVLSGSRLISALETKKVSQVASKLLTETERERLSIIARDLSLMERSPDAESIGGIISDAPNTLLKYFGTVVGARAGAKAGAGTSGASLKTASFFSNRVNKFLDRVTNDKAEALIRDAITDEDLFITLLRGDFNTQAGAAKTNAKLNAWLASAGSRYVDDDDEEESEPLRLTITQPTIERQEETG